MIRRQSNVELSPGTLARQAARRAERSGVVQPTPLELLQSVTKVNDNIAAEAHETSRQEAEALLAAPPPPPTVLSPKPDGSKPKGPGKGKGQAKGPAPVMETIEPASTTAAPEAPVDESDPVVDPAATTTPAPEPTGAIAPAPWAK